MKLVLKKVLSLFGYFPYQAALMGLQGYFKLTKVPVQIWARNSFALKTLEPGFSDLDLTFIFAADASLSEISECAKKIEAVRKYVPFIGEINTYKGMPTKEFFETHNFFELQRDPILLSKVPTINIKPDPIDAAVFLFRQLEKDINQLFAFPEKRIKKWQSHLHLIDKYLPDLKLVKTPLNPENLPHALLESILTCLGISHGIVSQNIREKLELYLELVRCGFDFGKSREIALNSSWWFVFSIHRIASIQLLPIKLSDVQLRFFVKQIFWEVHGCKSQVNESNKERVQNHLKNLQHLLKRQVQFQYSPELKESENIFN